MRILNILKLFVVIGWLIVISVHAEELPTTQGVELGTSSTTENHSSENVPQSPLPAGNAFEHEKKPNYVTYSTEPTVEKTCIPILNWELKIADVIALIVVFVGIVTILVTLLAIYAAVLPIFFEIRKKTELKEAHETAERHRQELMRMFKSEQEIKESLRKEFQEELKAIDEKYSRQVEKVIDRQAGRHEERLYRVERILNNLWDRRVTKVGQTSKEERLDAFFEEFRRQLKDDLTFRELLSTEPEAVFTALGTLKGRMDLPVEDFVDLLRLLYKQGKIHHDLTGIVREILDQWGKKLTDDEA